MHSNCWTCMICRVDVSEYIPQRDSPIPPMPEPIEESTPAQANVPRPMSFASYGTSGSAMGAPDQRCVRVNSLVSNMLHSESKQILTTINCFEHYSPFLERPSIQREACWCSDGRGDEYSSRYMPGVIKCSKEAARVQRQEVIRLIERPPSQVESTVLLRALLPYCVAGEAQSASRGYLNALQYALTRVPMTKDTLFRRVAFWVECDLALYGDRWSCEVYKLTSGRCCTGV
jgi:hypothetical protein